jgi:hypothetical protein
MEYLQASLHKMGQWLDSLKKNTGFDDANRHMKEEEMAEGTSLLLPV